VRIWGGCHARAGCAARPRARRAPQGVWGGPAPNLRPARPRPAPPPGGKHGGSDGGAAAAHAGGAKHHASPAAAAGHHQQQHKEHKAVKEAPHANGHAAGASPGGGDLHGGHDLRSHHSGELKELRRPSTDGAAAAKRASGDGAAPAAGRRPSGDGGGDAKQQHGAKAGHGHGHAAGGGDKAKHDAKHDAKPMDKEDPKVKQEPASAAKPPHAPKRKSDAGGSGGKHEAAAAKKAAAAPAVKKEAATPAKKEATSSSATAAKGVKVKKEFDLPGQTRDTPAEVGGRALPGGPAARACARGAACGPRVCTRAPHAHAGQRARP
jgi:hypothetical protein